MKPLCAALGLLFFVAAARADTTYSGESERESGPAWHHTLILKDNGSAIFRTIKSQRSGAMENGVWTKTAAGDLSVQFLNRRQEPRGAPVVWRLTGGQWLPVSWDKADWGGETPPKLRAR